jgi:hypothetical protein
MSAGQVEAKSSSRVSTETTERSINEIDIIGDQSPGVRRAKVLRDNLNQNDRIYIFVSLFLLAYVYTLDGTLRYVYQVRALGRDSIIELSLKGSTALCHRRIWHAFYSCNDQRSTQCDCCSCSGLESPQRSLGSANIS